MHDLLPDAGPRSPGNIAIAVLFVALLLAPAVLALAGRAGFDAAFIRRTELREPFVAPRPASGALATGGWQRDAERTIADAFPLRTELIASDQVVTYAVLHDLASPQVIVGRDGWLFYAGDEPYITGRYDMSNAAVSRTADAYAARAGWCADHGIAYVFVLAPNKSTIYPQYLPQGMTVATPALADRFVAALRARRVSVVDVRAAMRAAAVRAGTGASRLLYSKGDTHWTAAGAYFEYRAVMSVLRADGVRDRIEPRSLRPYVAVRRDADLLRLAGVASIVGDDVLQYRFPARAREVAALRLPGDPALASLQLTALTTGEQSLPNAVIFGDSFSTALRVFLAEDFDDTLVARYADTNSAQFDRRLVTTVKPRVVIQELVERSLPFGPGRDY